MRARVRVRVVPLAAPALPPAGVTVPARSLPLASAMPRATPRVLLLLSGTATMHPKPLVELRYTRGEEGPEAVVAGIWAHGKEPQAPSTKFPPVPVVKQEAVAVCTMSPPTP